MQNTSRSLGLDGDGGEEPEHTPIALKSRASKSGNPRRLTAIAKDFDTLRRAMDFVSRDADGHWRWHGNIWHRGRPEAIARFYYQGGRVSARRVVYSLFKPQLSRSDFLQRTCEVTECVNPDHCQIIKRGGGQLVNERRSVCDQGHRIEGENMLVLNKGRFDQRRTCRICMNRKTRERLHRYAIEGRGKNRRSDAWYVKNGLPIPDTPLPKKRNRKKN